MNDPISARLTDIFQKRDAQGSHVGTRLRRLVDTCQWSEAPPFPRQVQIETTNICNHSCSFCAYTTMRRPKRHMEKSLFRRLATEAYECGAREIGLFAGAEPLTCKWLDEYVAICRDIGYEYMYISTNGALGDESRFKKLLDAGLSSIKFSVNGGDRQTYHKVHGRDDFERVLENIRFVSAYRRTLARPVYLGVSFVATPDTAATYPKLKLLLTGLVDEFLYYEASNQSGQMEMLPPPPFENCALPFNKLHISREGYLKACCNDYENILAIEDLNQMSLAEAWHSPRFQQLRRLHIENRLDGTLCGKCIRNCLSRAEPINPDLFTSSRIDSELPVLRRAS